MMRLLLVLGIVLLLGIGVLSITEHGAGQAPAKVNTYIGETKALGKGVIRTWFTTDAAGTPLAIGANFTEAALQGLPMEVTETDLAFPAQAGVTGIDHFAVDWRVHGHIPPGVYDVPHFDFHFYLITPAEREQITANDADSERINRQPAPEMIPQGYVAAPGSAEARMGVHWIDPTSPEFHGQPFTTTFIYGFYNGRMAFLEPMVTRAYLLTRPTFAQDLKLPAAYPTPEYYPTRYAIKYDPQKRQYVVALQGMVKR